MQTSAATVYRKPIRRAERFQDVLTSFFDSSAQDFLLKYVKAQYFFFKAGALMMTDCLPDLKKEHSACCFGVSTPDSDIFLCQCDMDGQFERRFLLLECPHETHLSYHQIIRFKSPFRPTHEVVWAKLVHIEVLNLKIKMNTTETI